MRIISGKFRGKKLNAPEGDKVRPTTDMVKENVFNIMQTRIMGCKFLDLFAGSGAIGIEALSRGADSVVFCDIDRASLNLVRANLTAIDHQARLLHADYASALEVLKGEQFDVIYLDPPYGKIDMNNCLRLIADNDLLANNGIVICEASVDNAGVLYNPYYELTASKRYGMVTIQVLKRNVRALVMGSFDPITLGHLDVILQADNYADEVVVCVMVNPDKEYMFSIKEREEMITLATKGLKVTVDSYSGMCYEYCLANRIDIIVRGYRNAKDYEYEHEMAEFNKVNSGVDTILLKANEEYSHISSSMVKDYIRQGESLQGVVPDNVAQYIKNKGVR